MLLPSLKHKGGIFLSIDSGLIAEQIVSQDSCRVLSHPMITNWIVQCNYQGNKTSQLYLLHIRKIGFKGQCDLTIERLFEIRFRLDYMG